MMVMLPEKLPKETDEAYEMFIAYVGEGVPNLYRSFDKIAQQFGCSVSLVRQIAYEMSWTTRAAEFDVQYVKARAADKRRERVKDAQNDPQANLENAIALSLLSKAGTELNNVDDDESLSAALRLLACYQALKQKG